MLDHTFLFRDGTVLTFKCQYCREIESTNWHCYKRSSGEMLHIRKEHLMMVVGGTYDEIINNRIIVHTVGGTESEKPLFDPPYDPNDRTDF